MLIPFMIVSFGVWIPSSSTMYPEYEMGVENKYFTEESYLCFILFYIFFSLQQNLNQSIQ